LSHLTGQYAGPDETSSAKQLRQISQPKSAQVKQGHNGNRLGSYLLSERIAAGPAIAVMHYNGFNYLLNSTAGLPAGFLVVRSQALIEVKFWPKHYKWYRPWWNCNLLTSN